MRKRNLAMLVSHASHGVSLLTLEPRPKNSDVSGNMTEKYRVGRADILKLIMTLKVNIVELEPSRSNELFFKANTVTINN